MAHNTLFMEGPDTDASVALALDMPLNPLGAHPVARPGFLPHTEPLLREALGLTLRDFRTGHGLSLRELASSASISPGYLSELERGRKEVSSELLGAICHSMGVSVARVLSEAASMMALDAAAAELAANMPPSVAVGARAEVPACAVESS